MSEIAGLKGVRDKERGPGSNPLSERGPIVSGSTRPPQTPRGRGEIAFRALPHHRWSYNITRPIVAYDMATKVFAKVGMDCAVDLTVSTFLRGGSSAESSRVPRKA